MFKSEAKMLLCIDLRPKICTKSSHGAAALGKKVLQENQSARQTFIKQIDNAGNKSCFAARREKIEKPFHI